MVAVLTYLARPLLSGEDGESVRGRFPLSFFPLSLDNAIFPPEELGPGEATASALFIAALCFVSALRSFLSAESRSSRSAMTVVSAAVTSLFQVLT